MRPTRVYHSKLNEYCFKHFNLKDIFIEIVKNSIITPYALSRKVMDGCEYDQACDLFYIITPNEIFFEINRHY